MAHTKQNWFDNKEKRERWLTFVQTLNPTIDPESTRLMDEFMRVSKMIHHIGESSVDIAGLSLAQYRILMHLFFTEQLDGKEYLNPSEISEWQGTSRNTVSSLIHNLEKEGLVERSLDPHDRRKFNIRLTENGRSLVTNHARQHFQIVGQCFSTLTLEEQDTLSTLLQKINTQATKMTQ